MSTKLVIAAITKINTLCGIGLLTHYIMTFGNSSSNMVLSISLKELAIYSMFTAENKNEALLKLIIASMLGLSMKLEIQLRTSKGRLAVFFSF